ncbi:acyl-CoA dehydrogenase [Bacillus aquiflavi]|uniref:Acyl-CoA dehydrogenase n=1 Tax=Bacillus aquiflavi TaxID=2672567 RepID=A0A6B3VZB2_9BACI|nr:acyl-CoA dehydrogenase family protein [Bacillus aquiflavi]MBA4536584.1 acyl-CoA dehydrogenase [Bacillus aquiflavi]NEY80951.1 acyl-CoA dehydrogenase [Bacillus aquiflavi]
MSVKDKVKQQIEKNSGTLPTFSEPVKVGSIELEQLLIAIEQNAKQRRERGKEERPYYAIELIKESRLSALRLPVELGGGGASIRELFYVLIRLAEADPDVAHSLRYHYYQVEQFLRAPVSDRKDRWLKRIAAGEIIGNAFTEISARNVGTYTFDTSLTPDGSGYRLNGTKYFSTGTLFADWVDVLASNWKGETVSALIPTNREGVMMKDDWDGIGQRLTGSGTTILNNVFVNEEEVTITQETDTPFNSHLQLFLHVVIAGILRNVVTDAKDLVHSRRRTFTFAAAETAAADPQLQQVIGELSSITFAAEAIVLTAAEALDAAVNSAVDGVIDYGLSHEASLQAAQAKVVIDKLALKASTLLFEVGGASATKQSAHLDRHWRNIRTIASHNPTVYKARAIGNYVVNGTELPIQEVYF